MIAIEPGTQDRWVVDIFRQKGMGYQQQVDTIIGLAKKYDCNFVFCEANQYQRVISDMVVRQSDVPIKAFYTTGKAKRQATNERRGMSGTYSSNKNALDRGVPGLRMLLENNKIRIPWEEESQERVEVWMREMQAFGFQNGKLQGVGAHDDTVMAFWMSDQAARVGGSVSMDFQSDLVGSSTGTGPEWSPNDNSSESDMDWFGSGEKNRAPALNPSSMFELSKRSGEWN